MYALNAEDADEAMIALGISNDLQVRKFRADASTSLRRQVDSHATANVCVISSEHFHSRLKTPEQIERVAKLLNEIFSSVEVYIHLRPQVDVLVSLASTQSRVGGVVRKDFFERAVGTSWYFNYQLLVSAWAEVFGLGATVCVPFKRKPDFLSVLSKSLCLDLSSFEPIERINEALDIGVMAIVNALSDAGQKQKIDFRVLDLLPVRQRLELNAKTAKAIQSRFVDSNRSLVDSRPDLQPGDLQPDWSKYPQTGNAHLLDDNLFLSGAISDLIDHYNLVITQLGDVKDSS